MVQSPRFLIITPPPSKIKLGGQILVERSSSADMARCLREAVQIESVELVPNFSRILYGGGGPEFPAPENHQNTMCFGIIFEKFGMPNHGNQPDRYNGGVRN